MSRKWVDKKRDQTYQVVFRSHEDPLYHDPDAPEHVLVPVENRKQKHKIKTKTDLEKELGDEIKQMRDNEGEAALYGITFDDSKYDYLQHLKPIGQGNGVFIPAKGSEEQKNKKGGVVFKDQVDLPEDILPSKQTVKLTYQDQQNIPDDIQGFKPDMNPALREVLEALEDEAYVDDDEDIFADLLQGGDIEPVDEDEFEDQFDEWDLDNYGDDLAKYDDEHFAEEGDQGWEAGFRKFKAMNKHKKNEWDSDDEFEDENEDDFAEQEENDELPELPSFNQVQSKSKKGTKRKERRKKGAMSDTSSFSMSSSALVRSESLRLLDDRFEQVLKTYEEAAEEEEEEEYKPFDMKTERADLEDLLDEFLDNYEIEGGRRIVKKNEEINKLKEAADSVSRGKLAQKRKKEKAAKAGSSLSGLTGSLNNMKI